MYYLCMSREFIYNCQVMKNRRRQLRNNPTEAEVILWKEIKNSKLGFRFTRQYSVIGYVLDFFCPVKRLGVEVDGAVHDSIEASIYDGYRTRWLGSAEIKIVRFRNEEIMKNLNDVIEVIRKCLVESPPLKVRGGEGVLC